MRTRPGAFLAPLLFVFFGLAGGALPAPAATDPVAAGRAYFPQRPWTPRTAVDAALAGAGRAVDPLSGWLANPALVAGFADSGRVRARLTVLAVDPHRNDVAGGSGEYSDKSPFPTVGETGLAIPIGETVFLLGVDQPGFHREETAFLDPVSFGPPTFITNEVRSYLQRASLGAARGFGDWQVGVALQGFRITEHHSTDFEAVAIGFGAVPGELELSGTGLGGAVGVTARPHRLLRLGASYGSRVAVDMEDPDGQVAGSDEVPASFTVGAAVGNGLGGNLHFSGGWTGQRTATLPDTLGRGTEFAGARWETGVGYAYRSRTAPWEFRAGFGWSPRPADGGPRSNRFGAGLGYDLEGLRLHGSFASESIHPTGDRVSSRSLFVLSAEIDL